MLRAPPKQIESEKKSPSVDNYMISRRDKKASEVFLTYIAPVLQGDIEKLTIKEIETAISLPLAVWNAMAMQEWKGAKANYLEDLYGTFKNEASYTDTKELIDVFVKRKKKFYKNAFWAFEIKVVKQSAGRYLFDASVQVSEELKGRVSKDWMRDEKITQPKTKFKYSKRWVTLFSCPQVENSKKYIKNSDEFKKEAKDGSNKFT